MLESLSRIFTQGFLLKDSNDDGITDCLNTRIILSGEASAEEIAAACNIAARLGFETMGLDLPIVLRDSDPSDRAALNPILLGKDNKVLLRLVKEGRIKLEECGSGEGLIQLHAPSLNSDWTVIVAGVDDAGTRAAANYVAMRMPYLWDLGGVHLEGLEKDVMDFLSEHETAVNSCQTTYIVVGDAESLVRKLGVTVNLEKDGDLLSAEEVLLKLASAHTKNEMKNKLSYPAVSSLHIHLSAKNLSKDVTIQAVKETETSRPSLEDKRGPPRELSLSNLHSVDGLLEASGGLIPDNSNTLIVTTKGALGTINIAARLGLESTGVQIPLAKADLQVKEPRELVNPILVGIDNSWVKTLIKEEKLKADELSPGEGLVQVVPKAFENRDALVLLGTDEKGLDTACMYVSERLPHLWVHRKGEVEISEIEEDIRRFFSSRTGAGQAAAALYRIGKVLSKIRDKPEEMEISLFAEGAKPELGELVKDLAKEQTEVSSLRVEVGNLDTDGGVPIIDETVDLLWEVDKLWERLEAEVLPRVAAGSSINIEVRVSEPPDTRERLQREILEELVRRGCSDENVKVVVLSAYKQGFSWLNDSVIPRVRDKGVNSVKITFAPIDAAEIRWQTIESPVRWLQELYPIDEVLARELVISPENVVFEKGLQQKPTYRVEFLNGEGKAVYADEFDPKYVVQPFLAKFPEYEKIRVATGWVRAVVDGAAVLDERIMTDTESFWYYYQHRVLGTVFENVMDTFEGAPSPAKAPYFNKLEVEVWMSEPDYSLGVDEEQISSLEALHEDIYFETLTLFDVMGLFYSGERLSYPGCVIPRVHPSRPSRGPTVRVKYTGKAASNPQLLVKWRGSDGLKKEIREDLPIVETKDPRTLSALLRSGEEGVAELGFQLEVDMRTDRREELAASASSEMVERQFFSAEQARKMIEILGLLHQRGLYGDALSYPHLTRMKLCFVSPEGKDFAELEVTESESRTVKKHVDYQHEGETIVQWKKPISPEECRDIISKLNTFPQVTAYPAGRSYLGREIWAMDVMLPVKASLWSQAKASVYKPTLILSGRQHANEVSSTSHILRLVELLATDPSYRRFLDRVNVVAHPITNIDGAALGCDLYQLTPQFMMHAAYLGSLGVDACADQWNRDSKYPEARVRPKLWRTWLPDIFLNPHGYPSHEWVQLFAGYSAWVRSRLGRTGKSWWIPRGWFIPGFNYVEDLRFPKHRDVAFAVRDYIVDGINSSPQVRAMNERMYARRRRYGRFDPEVYKEGLYRGVMVNTALRGVRKNPASTGFMTRYPEITVLEGSTEAPDETASGDWLELVCSAGLAYDLAHLRFLYNSKYEVKRYCREWKNCIVLSLARPRPVLPS